MGEPLKHKCSGFFDSKSLSTFDQRQFKYKDIESAVEWLKEQFKTMSSFERDNDACVNNIIDKAFEDVVK